MLDMEDKIAIRGFLTDIYPVRWIALKYMEKDEQILSLGRKLNPELSAVLEGMVIAAKAIQSHQGFIYVRTEYPLAVRRLRRRLVN